MGDDQEAAIGRAERVHALGHQPHRINVQTGIGLVHDAHFRFQHGHLQDFVALLFPAREADIHRALQHLGVDIQRFCLFAHDFQEVGGGQFFLAARLALCVHGGAQEGQVADAGDFHRVLEGQEQASGGAFFGFQIQQIFAVQGRFAFGHLIAVAARQHIRQRRLARAVRPHDRMDLARRHFQRDALEDLLALVFQFGVEVVDFQHRPVLPSVLRRPGPVIVRCRTCRLMSFRPSAPENQGCADGDEDEAQKRRPAYAFLQIQP